jgi:hypothetical protein
MPNSSVIFTSSFTGTSTIKSRMRTMIWRYTSAMKMMRQLFPRLVLASTILFTCTANSEDTKPIKFIAHASDVAQHVLQISLKDYLALYISPELWHAALSDGDIGPFLATQEQKSHRSAVCIVAISKVNTICVFFDGSNEYGYIATQRKPGSTQKPDLQQLYHPVTSDDKQPGIEKYTATPRNVYLDNGTTPIPAVVISLAP